MIEAALATQLPEGDRLEYLFVSAAYYREFGDLDKAGERRKLLQKSLKESSDPKLKGFVEYLTELERDLDRITPGGPLIPEEKPAER